MRIVVLGGGFGGVTTVRYLEQLLRGHADVEITLVSRENFFVLMPLTFDAKFMAFRLLSPVPFSVFQTLLYLRLRRLVPFAVVHALLDGTSVLIGVLLPQLKA